LVLIIKYINFYLNIFKNLFFTKNGDWGLGIGDWGLGPIPNPQSPIPNPQSPIFLNIRFLVKKRFLNIFN
jgi:hypothetical protein